MHAHRSTYLHKLIHLRINRYVHTRSCIPPSIALHYIKYATWHCITLHVFRASAYLTNPATYRFRCTLVHSLMHDVHPHEATRPLPYNESLQTSKLSSECRTGAADSFKLHRLAEQSNWAQGAGRETSTTSIGALKIRIGFGAYYTTEISSKEHQSRTQTSYEDCLSNWSTPNQDPCH